MSKNILIAFGDSYGAGAELFESNWKLGDTEHNNDQYNFVRLLSSNYHECYNFSSVGASIPGYIEQLHKLNQIYNSKNKYTLIVMLTQHNRDHVFIEDTGWINLYPGMMSLDNIYKKVAVNWYKTVKYPETGIFNWYKTISIIQAYCQNKNINSYFVEQFSKSPFIEELEFLIDRSNIYSSPIIKDIFFKNSKDTAHTFDWSAFLKTANYQKYYAPNYHPNINGHKLIANKIKNLLNI